MSATYDDLCCQVGQIIEFSVRQKEFFTQFGLTVIPLFQSVSQEDVNSGISYYQGISAKEIHIAKIMMLSEKKSCNNSMRS